MSRSRKKISPESTGRLPEIWWISVVLPAPFGPMSACTSPAVTSSVTASTATTPPKRLLRLLSESTGNSLRGEEHDREEDHAQRKLPVKRVRAEERAAREKLLQSEKHRGADRSSPEAAHAPEDYHDHERARLHPMPQRRADIARPIR